MPQVNEFSGFTRGPRQPFEGQNVPQSVRDKLAAALALQRAGADSSQPVYSKGLGFAKMGAGLAGGIMQGITTAQTEAALQSHRDKLANAILNYGSGAGASPAAPPPAGSPAPAPAGSPGGSPGGSVSDHEAFLRQYAAQKGINPDLLVAVAKHEGLGAKGPGDGGSSYGDLQLHYGGVAPGGNSVPGLGDDFTKQTGLDARDPKNWQEADKFAVDNIAANGWGAFHGSQGIVNGPMDGIGQPSAPVAAAGVPGPTADASMPPAAPPPDQGSPMPASPPLPPPGAQSQPPLTDVNAAGGPPPDAMSLAGPDPMASAPAQQAISSAVQPGDPASAPSANPALVQAMMSSGRGVNDPNSPQAFNAQQASPLAQALMTQGGGGQMPSAGAPPAPSVAGGASQDGAPAPARAALVNALAGQNAPQGQGDFRSQASDLLRDPYTTPEEASMVMSRLAPQFNYQKADNGDIVRLDPRGILPPQAVYKGGKFTSSRNGVIFNEGDGSGPGGASGAGGANGFRPATDQERAQYGVTDRPMYIGPGGEPHFGMPGAPTQGETEEAKKAGESAATRRNDMITGADAAPEKIARLKLLGTVLDATQSGPLAEEIGNAAAIAQRLGIPNDRLAALGIDPNQPVNNAIANKLAGEMTMSSIGAKNGGMPASNFSVAERQFIEALYPNIEHQPGGNRAVTDVLTAVEQRKLQVADAWAQYKDQQRQGGKPLSYEDFEDSFRKAHAQDNIFQPIEDRYKAGGYTPNVPPPPSAGGNAPPAMSTPPGQQAAPAPAAAQAQPQAAPPMQGAKQAPDGNWYVPDPNRPGKYLMVKP